MRTKMKQSLSLSLIASATVLLVSFSLSGTELNLQRETEGDGKAKSTAQPKNFPDDTPVYYSGGKRGHIDSCRRVSDEQKAKGPNTTYGEMVKKGGLLCSRCPGSKLNVEREAGSSQKSSGKKSKDRRKYGRKGAKARAAWLKIPEKEYDPNTKAYCDALWMRVHESDCPMLVLKDQKKVITLTQADKEGWRIGESGQSGRSRCCFKGYRRKHPEKEFTDETLGITQIMKSGKLKWHQAGCHRFTVSPEHVPMTMGEAMSKTDMNPYVCIHCIERGPGFGMPDFEALKKRPAPSEFSPHDG